MGVALPQVMNELGITAATGQWLTTAYALTMAVIIPATGFLMQRFDMRPLNARQGGGPATHWQLDDGLIVGFISAMSEHFCEACNRLRLQCNGDLRTCLSRDDSPNLRDTLRSGADDDAVEQLIRSMVWGKVAGHEAHLGRAFEGTMTKVGG